MKHPTSLTCTRARSLLPKRTKRGFEWPSITEDEALFIKHLDESYTWSEVASYLLGVSDYALGSLLVTAAERKVGDRVPKPKLVVNLEKIVRAEDEDEPTTLAS